ncbi:MAG: class I SAM-dependent methyltransferase [Steroidobacteraceae bacterium]
MTSGLPLIDSWLGDAPGASLLEAETALLAEVLDDVFGWELLQVGLWGAPRGLIQGSRTRQQTVIAERAAEGVDLVARLPQLPIASGAVDAVLLPHTLEFLPDAKAMIREVDRVLAGEGQLIVAGLRPWSLWGLRSRLSRGRFPPGVRQLYAERRICDWLALLGYEIIASRHYLHGAYILKARKRVYTMTPIRIRPRERAAVLGSLVKPTSRTRS